MLAQSPADQVVSSRCNGDCVRTAQPFTPLSATSVASAIKDGISVVCRVGTLVTIPNLIFIFEPENLGATLPIYFSIVSTRFSTLGESLLREML